MKKQIKAQQDVLGETKKEQELTRLFNQCLKLMDAAYRKHHQLNNAR